MSLLPNESNTNNSSRELSAHASDLLVPTSEISPSVDNTNPEAMVPKSNKDILVGGSTGDEYPC
jgi:hypothetical protein